MDSNAQPFPVSTQFTTLTGEEEGYISERAQHLESEALAMALLISYDYGRFPSLSRIQLPHL